MRMIWLVLGLLLAAPVAAEDVVKIHAGVNGVWFDDEAKPSDFEVGGSVRASVSPHISGVGGVWYGVDHNYYLGEAGVRVTASDVLNPNFSVGLGIVYRGCSKPDLRAEEWCPDVSVGWRPWPNSQPKLILGARGLYGLQTNEAEAIAAVRYQLWGGGYR